MYIYSVNIFTSPNNMKHLSVVEDEKRYVAIKKAWNWIQVYHGRWQKKKMFVMQVNGVKNPYEPRFRRNRTNFMVKKYSG